MSIRVDFNLIHRKSIKNIKGASCTELDKEKRQFKKLWPLNFIQAQSRLTEIASTSYFSCKGRTSQKAEQTVQSVGTKWIRKPLQKRRKTP